MVEKALGKVNYSLTKKERQSRVFRRSIFVVRDIKKGEVFSEENIRVIRPAGGLPPKYWERLLGKGALKNIKAGTPITQDVI